MPAIWSVVGWNAPGAHNGFIDELLATGIVGLTLFTALWLTGLAKAAASRFLHNDAFAALVLLSMLFFLVSNFGDSLMQAYTRFPFYVSLIALFTLLGRRAREHASSSPVVHRAGVGTAWSGDSNQR